VPKEVEGMGEAKEKITISIPKEIVDKIAELNNVDKKYIDRTIVKILKDEIDVEKKLKELQKEKSK
jgi:hypothetical protein